MLLPIDSKFPGDAYEHLLDAQESGDAEAVAAARKTLDMMVKREAKDICEKYLSVPATTNFGIMFVPFEGLSPRSSADPGSSKPWAATIMSRCRSQHYGRHSQQPADELPDV